MKILCVIDSLGSGGAQRQLVEIAKGFKEKGHEVGFITYHEINFFKPELEKNEIWVETIVEANYLKRLLKMRKEIRRQKPDAVLSFLEAANFISTLSGFPYRKWKLVVGERSANPKILKSIKLRFYRLFHLFADYIVANSHANLDIVNKINPFLSDDKCKVIYNVLNIQDEQISIYEGLNEKDYITVVVGASHRYLKNLNLLVEAFIHMDNNLRDKFRVEWYGDRIIEPYFDNSLFDAKKLIEQHGLDKYFYFFEATQGYLCRNEKMNKVI